MSSPDESQTPKTVVVVDTDRIGSRGYPRHYEAYGLEPPVKLVSVPEGIDDGDGEVGDTPQTNEAPSQSDEEQAPTE